MVQEKRKRDIDLGKDPVGRLVVRLAVPAVLAQLINLLYNLVDRMYVGSIPQIGTQALAGLGGSISDHFDRKRLQQSGRDGRSAFGEYLSRRTEKRGSG